MNLSPWFKTSEPPERPGMYQIKGWDGQIRYAEFEGRLWWDAPRSLGQIPPRRICVWRGVTKP